MRRVALAVRLVLAVAAVSPAALAQDPAPPSVTAAPAAPAPVAASRGLGVVALGGATDAAWPLAQAIYGTPSLRPSALDEAHARILCGEPAAAGAPADVRDLAESLAAVKGEDAPSRMLLGEIARRLNVRALLVVRVEAGHASARVFLPETGTFDAAAYAPDAGPTITWAAATQSLARTFGGEPSVPAPTSAPSLATHEEPVITVPPPRGKAFYESGWFWGAMGAAAFAAGAIFFATRDNGESTIHLQVQVPH
jgi:hypothetical protein